MKQNTHMRKIDKISWNKELWKDKESNNFDLKKKKKKIQITKMGIFTTDPADTKI